MVTLGDLANAVKARLGVEQVQLVGAPGQPVELVAVVCGSGGELLADACHAGADVLVTGELSFHDCLTAQALGLTAVLPGHYASERFAVEELAVRLQTEWPDLEVWVSRKERDPAAWL